MTNSKGMLVKPPPATGEIPAPPLVAPPPAPAKAGVAGGTLQGPAPKACDAAKAKAKGARPTVNKPGARKTNIASKTSRAKEAKANMSKSGSIDDVAKFLLNS